MKLKLYNTKTRQIEEFTPINQSEVLVYSCGPTVYDELHVGNWAAYIYWDVLVRVLLADGYNVKQTINITDVGHLTDDADSGEDKLDACARKEGTTAWGVALKYTESFLRGREQLNLVPPANFAKATDYIDQQLKLAQNLKDKGLLYQIDDGIYFDTSKFPTYSEFAKLNLDSQKSGARVSQNPQKKNPSDFAVWKFSPTNKKRDMEWLTPETLLVNSSDSSVGDQLKNKSAKMGFPGWHLECSTIILETLAPTIDIHTGGIDHIAVHHTNEIAQSESTTGQKLANYWLHNNHMKSNGTKISKSLSNGYTLSNIIEKNYSPVDFRMFVLQSHYQNESNFSFDNLTAAKNRLANWRKFASLRHQSYATIDTHQDTLTFLPEPKLLLEKLNNNLNTPEALSLIDSVFNKIESSSKKIDRVSFVEFLESIDELLGFNLLKSTPDIDDDMKKLIIKRRNAREEEDFRQADEIRQVLLQNGLAIWDSAKGSYWYYL